MKEKGKKVTYRDAGVDIDSATDSLKKVKGMVTSTFTPNVLSGIGHFGTLFDLSGTGFKSPVLVASADGVGTKLKIAFMTGKHDTVGMDIVNHCTNDILVQGATPLFFLDYIATGKFEPHVFEQLIAGLSTACKENNMALVGGETAEMPDFYSANEYDIAGFIVGAVEKSKVIDGSTIKNGDIIIGLRSSGLHTNGYSLVRKVLFDMEGLSVDDKLDGIDCSLGEELLKPHRSYLKAVKAVDDVCEIKGMAHITGGGLTDNIPRILPENVSAEIKVGSWPVPQIFKRIIEFGGLSSDEALRVFNMGVGLVIILDKDNLETAQKALSQVGFDHDLIGEIVEDDIKRVIFKNI